MCDRWIHGHDRQPPVLLVNEMMRHCRYLPIPRRVVGAMLALILTATCAPAPEQQESAQDELARVGPYAVTRADLDEAVSAIFGASSTPASIDAAQFAVALDALVGARVLALEAERRGLDQDPEIVAALDSVERVHLREAIYERDVYPGVAQATEADIANLYQEWGRGEQVRAAHILVRSQPDAVDLLARLAQGQDFAELARTYSQHTASGSQGGTMGYMRRGQYPVSIATAIWQLPVGDFIPEPIRSHMGWHIVTVSGRRTLTLEQQRVALETEFVRRQRRSVEDTFQQRLRADYKVVYHPQTAVAVASLLDTLSGQRRLFSWRDGALDLAGFLKRVQVPDPVSEDTARMRRLAEELVFDELAADQAKTRGYTDLAKVRKPLRDKRLRLLGERMFELEAGGEAEVGQVREFFESHREQFRSHTVITIREILVDSAVLADSLHGLISGGQDMELLARQFTVRTDLQKTGGLWEDVRPRDPRSGRIYERALEHGPGLHEPVKVAGGYSVFDVLDVRQGRQLQFAEAEATVRESFAGYRMEQLMDRLRDDFGGQIWVDTAALESMRAG